MHKAINTRRSGIPPVVVRPRVVDRDRTRGEGEGKGRGGGRRPRISVGLLTKVSVTDADVIEASGVTSLPSTRTTPTGDLYPPHSTQSPTALPGPSREVFHPRAVGPHRGSSPLLDRYTSLPRDTTSVWSHGQRVPPVLLLRLPDQARDEVLSPTLRDHAGEVGTPFRPCPNGTSESPGPTLNHTHPPPTTCFGFRPTLHVREGWDRVQGLGIVLPAHRVEQGRVRGIGAPS